MKFSNKIQRSLMPFVRGNGDIVIPNYFHDCYEMDLFRLTPTEYIYEYEIKISRSNYFADFKKGNKHERLQKGLAANRFFFVVPENLISIAECPKYAGLIYAKPRMFRFDFAIVDKMIAIEYEGINGGKSRHTTLTGYTKDTEKYNLAQQLGWKVYRYTALNYKDFNLTI